MAKSKYDFNKGSFARKARSSRRANEKAAERAAEAQARAIAQADADAQAMAKAEAVAKRQLAAECRWLRSIRDGLIQAGADRAQTPEGLATFQAELRAVNSRLRELTGKVS